MKKLTGKTFTSIYHALEDNTATTMAEEAEAAIIALRNSTNADDAAIKSELKAARKMMKEWDVQLESYHKATEFFEKYDYYARVYKMSKKQRFQGSATAFLSSQMNIEFWAARNNQNVNTYDDMKKWMFWSPVGMARVAQIETKLSNWKMKREHNLLQAYQDLMAIVNEDVEEIKFAAECSAKEHEIIKVQEKTLAV